jgi:superfamily I DNA/RNA helicase
MDFEAFVSKSKSMITAPAGYGKTHVISECLNYTEGKQLILTHTHAGVAALKEKIQKQGIGYDKYHVETIESFAQKYVNAFYCGNDIPEQDNSDAYYPFIREKAKNLFKITPITDVIKTTYSGLFVDEYQDCTIGQHEFIIELSEILPTHILGDYLQGIFGFKERLVEFNEDLKDFEQFPSLSHPWRWQEPNPKLGEYLKQIRKLLEEGENIDLNVYDDNIEILCIDENDKYMPGTIYNRKIWDLVDENSILIIHPESENLNARKHFISKFNVFFLVESVDSKDFYKFSQILDCIDNNNVYSVIYQLVPKIFNGTSSRNNWFNENGPKRKSSLNNRKLIEPIKNNIEELQQSISFVLISSTLKAVEKLPGIKCYRKELFSDLCKALERAEYKDISVYDAMKEIRNIRRRVGRKVKGRCIGTTLLTKGLEFDTVAVLDAHKFNCPKNFYVAITRACNKLIIFTNSMILSPYK